MFGRKKRDSHDLETPLGHKGPKKPFSWKKWGIIGGIATTVGSCSLVGAYAGATRVTERDLALKTVRGDLVDGHVTQGLKWDDYMPQVEYIKFPKYRIKTEDEAGQDDIVAIRTKEKTQVYGKFKTQWTLDGNDPNFPNVYTELKADSIEDLSGYVKDFIIPAAIPVYQGLSNNEINNDIPGIGNKMKETMQGYMNERGYTYIHIEDVLPSGVGLSRAANTALEDIVAEDRKMDLLESQKAVAKKAEEVTAEQTKVTVKAYQDLRAGGIPESQLSQAYYLQLMNVFSKVGEPGVPGPIPGTGAGIIMPTGDQKAPNIVVNVPKPE